MANKHVKLEDDPSLDQVSSRLSSDLNLGVKQRNQEDSASVMSAGGEEVIDMSTFRIIQLKQSLQQKWMYGDNSIVNTKYTVFSFVPKVLYNQFKYFFNLFFLVIALSQMFKALRVGFLISFVGPLAFVLTVTMIKEAYDDMKRYNKDCEQNARKFEKIDLNAGVIREVEASTLAVGDLVKIHANQAAPADLLLVHVTDKSDSIFIRTDQLDGETDWKARRPINSTHKNMSKIQDLTKFVYDNLMCEQPNQEIYQFTGLYTHLNEQTGEQQKEALGLENTMWANTVLASQGYVIGLVVYCGRQTRAQMNAKLPSSKMCLLEEEVNFLSKMLFIFLMSLSAVITMLNGFHGHYEIFYFRIVILLCSIIPISVRINLDLAKLFYCFKINNDEHIPGVIARNSNIPEELGRIQFLLSDKTGTLTQNVMTCMRIHTEFAQYSIQDNKREMLQMIEYSCQQSPNGPAYDYILDPKTRSFNAKRREQSVVLRDMLTALALCNNVTPVLEQENQRASNNQALADVLEEPVNRDEARKSIIGGMKEPQLEASSPDEVAMVKFGFQLNMSLVERDRTFCFLRNAGGGIEEYDVLVSFPFTSESKKMGILIKSRQTKKILYYVKGAEVVIEPKIKAQARPALQESCENLALDGLRTLVFAQKLITQEECDKFMARLQRAQQRLRNREQHVLKVQSSLEIDMDYLGVTGVEDKLQKNVESTIESLKSAGIQIWMLTGDKVETATSISISSGLKSRKNQLFFMRELTQKDEINSKLDLFSRHATNCCLIIDGKTLSSIWNDEDLKRNFFTQAMRAPCVCICRCSPTQKADVTKHMRLISPKRVAGIGDGGNDVGMILEADCGIGIEGKEGMQASLAADFSIKEFGQIKKLILWHGRLSYRRSAVLAQFVFHRGLIISIVQAFFTVMFYFVAIPIYNGYLMMGYSTIYTNLPIFSLVFDEDADVDSVLQFPPLYKSLQKGRSLSLKTFSVWLWKSVYQGSTIILFTIVFFRDSFTNIVTITFTALIMIECLNVYTQIHKMDFPMVMLQIATLTVYFLSILFMRQYFDVSYMDEIFFVKVFAIVAVTWLPMHMLYYLLDYLDPSEHKRVMEHMNMSITR